MYTRNLAKLLVQLLILSLLYNKHFLSAVIKLALVDTLAVNLNCLLIIKITL